MVYVAMHAISDRDLEQTVVCKPSHLQYDIEMAKRIFYSAPPNHRSGENRFGNISK